MEYQQQEAWGGGYNQQQSVMPGPEEYKMQMLDELDERMRRLEASHGSITETGDLLMVILTKDPSLVPFIVSLWSRLLVRSQRTRKVAYVYLLNDILQKSILQQNASKHYLKAFEGLIENSLESLFAKQLSSEKDKSIKVDIVRVVNVWISRQLYAESTIIDLVGLKTKLMKIAKITEEDVNPQLVSEKANNQQKSAEAGNPEVDQIIASSSRTQHILTPEMLPYGLDEIDARPYLEMAAYMSQLDEMRTKVAIQQAQIDAFLENPDAIPDGGETPVGSKSEILTTMMKDFKISRETYQMYSMIFLEKYGQKHIIKVDQSLLQEVLTAGKIDDYIVKVQAKQVHEVSSLQFD
ncbi:hypothetical protein FGO68_gene5552 [Halteria grandinella]|uniref:CID domain-containing protein n=1 Tax=Halteria grandinella TaxID=5974 RepID=A0A8J8NNB8_HALGN|nr:hypothetical protein FGO68_gene5552 [Halteria grandinella]